MRAVISSSLALCVLALAGQSRAQVQQRQGPQQRPALKEVLDFGPNPTNLSMAIYVPENLVEKPAVILALHACGMTGPLYRQIADYTTVPSSSSSFITIYPSTPNDFHCWDVATPASLHRLPSSAHDASDSAALARMVRHVLSQYSADPSRVYVTGSSSGCMMTSVLTALYPDLFSATSCYSGVPAACFTGSKGSSPFSATGGCAEGIHPKSGEEWKSLAEDMFPGWAEKVAKGEAKWPRVQTWHGKADTFVSYLNLAEQVKQWSAVMGLEFVRNETDVPIGGYTRMVFADAETRKDERQFVAYSAEGVGHTVPVRVEDDLKWFGLL